MMAGFLRSIRNKLLLMVLIANISALVVAGGALIYNEVLQFRKALVDELTTQADLLGQASAPALQFNDSKAAEENLAQLRAQPKVLAAAIYTANGGLFATYRRHGAVPAALPALSVPDGIHVLDSELRLSRRVANEREVLGTVYLVARYDLYPRLLDYLTVLGLAAVGSMLVAMAISSRVQRWVSRPIQSVSEVARQVMESRNFGLRAAKTTDDEIGYLVDAFNDMLAEIGRRTEAIESSKRKLESEIAERREIQKSLQISEARNRNLASAMSSVIWNCSPAGGFVEEQASWAAHTGQSRAQYAGLGWRQAFHPEDRLNIERAWALALHGADAFEVEARLWHAPTQRYREVILRGVPMTADDGAVVEWIGAVHDVDDRRIAEREVHRLNTQLEQRVAERTAQLEVANRELVARTEEAEAANRAKADFLANMSHEIRTPMNAILGLAYLLEKHELAPVARSMVEKIHTSGRSLLGIINDILDFSKIDAQRLEIEHVPFQLSEVLDNLASIMSAAVGGKSIEVVVGPPPEGAEFLKGDALRLGQVLVNLAGNAIKFTEQGEVVVSIARVDSGAAPGKVVLRFVVRDTGIGIPKDKQQAIFSAFSQADTSTSRSFGGTGLGLAISRRLVDLMGGELCVASAPGQGSEFSFELPFAVSDPAKVAMPAMLFQHVLIADDNAMARQALSATASSLGWRVDAVDSGQGAISAACGAEDSPYDVMLLDWRMPGIDGLAAATAIREQGCGATAPIIVMVTALDRELLRAQPGSEVADAILTKPVTSSCLYNAVMEAKDRRGELPSGAPARSSEMRLLGRRILVVDDSEINREVASQILGSEGAEVEVAADGRIALTLLDSRPDDFDLVLMDVQMPVMDGYATTREIRATPTLARLPVVALTAGAFKNQHVAALEAGMNDFVAKPFNVDDLVAVVQRHAPGAGQAPQAEDAPTPAEAPAPAPRSEALLDTERALRLWREPEAYRQRLHIFSSDYLGIGEEIRDALGRKDRAEAEFLAHRLRGAAGALSLMRVAEEARCTEADLHQGRDAGAAALRLVRALAETAAAIEAYAGPAPAALPEEAQAPAGGAGLEEGVARLRQALRSDDPDLIEPAFQALSGRLPALQFQQLRASIEAFDFRAAEALIDETATPGPAKKERS